MSPGSVFAIGFALVGVFLAALYGVLAARQLRNVEELTPLQTATTTEAGTDAANDVPTMRFKGEAFEATWGGGRGYEREAGSPAPQNWTDRLVIPVFTPLRPSRFDEPSYWRAYLPGVFAVWLFFFVALPLLIGALARPAKGSTAHSVLVFSLVGLALVIICFDIVITIRLRRATHRRFTGA